MLPAILFLTTDEVVKRYREEICTSTLRNWRTLKVGPSFLKLGKSVLYPLAELEAWELKNMVVCSLRASKSG